MKTTNKLKLWWVLFILRPFSYLGRALICYSLCIYLYNEGMSTGYILILTIIWALYQGYYVLGDWLTETEE